MAFTAPFTAVTGAVFTAAQWNTSGRDNINALWPGTTAGDIDYYSSATAKTRIAIGTAGKFLRVNAGATAPEWGSGQILHAKTIYTFSPGGQTHTSASYIDVTNGSTTIVTTKTCTIVMIAMGVMGIDNNSRTLYVTPMISGTSPADTEAAKLTGTLAGIFPYSVAYYRTGIAAATITCKLQTKLDSSVSVIGYMGSSGTIMLLAFEE